MRPNLVRDMPVNQEAEQALLGALLVNNAAIDRDEVTALEPHHFAVEIHGRIFQAIKKTIERGEVADPVTLRTLFAAEIAFEGPEYLARLAAASASIINAEHYARVIRRLFVQRRMIEAGQAVIDLFSRPDVDSTVEGDVAEAERIVAAVSDETVTVDRMGHVSVALRTAVERAEAAYKVGGITGLPTGLADLDRAITGLHPSNLIVVAGRPGMGKTALGLNVAFAAAKRSGAPLNGAIAFFSLEMSADELAARVLAEETGISVERVRGGRIGQSDIDRLFAVSQTLDRVPLFIDDTPALTVPQVRLRARRLQRLYPLALVVVDYIQLIRAPNRSENRVQEVSEITRSLKETAKALRAPVMALSQLSRKCEEREDKRPILSDLRESGSIEQDADVVIGLYRDEVYVEQDKPRDTGKERADVLAEKMRRWNDRVDSAKGLAEAIVLKNRHGATRTVCLHFDGGRGRFENLARDA